MTTGFKMVRIPDDLAERITATGHKREPFVREAVEAALARNGVVPSQAPPEERHTPPAGSPRASGVRGGCREHPKAGAVENRGQWWCAEPGCLCPAIWRDAA